MTSRESLDDGAWLQAIREGTAGESGERFFAELVRNLARALGTRGAWVTELSGDRRRLRSIAFWLGDDWIPDYEYDIAGTPCEAVVEDRKLVHIPDRAIDLFPQDADLPRLGVVSYLGVPLLDVDGSVLGHLAVLDTRPMEEDPRILAVFQVFGARSAAELRRLRAESALRERDERLNVLAGEAEYLREELRLTQGFGEILGRSEPILRLLEEIHQVAGTGATVLIQGETGTGKELVARAIHEASPRGHGPFIKVNCGALPEAVIESELFGHERGAFTGAAQRRDGRFTVANMGTILLDEIGELKAPLQVKLLRVLQEGEFEPVGSSKTRRVDVRVIAATNRNLQQAVAEREFRGDLYFRLNVFPIHVPPLRERGGDVALLAETFARHFAGRLGRRIEPLTTADFRVLESHDWPGNVRELQNVIERAVIRARDGRMDLSGALPESVSGRVPAGSPPPVPVSRGAGLAEPIHTDAEMKELERRNILRALESADWRISGAGGAAERLGMRPSTLASRMRSLGVERP